MRQGLMSDTCESMGYEDWLRERALQKVIDFRNWLLERKSSLPVVRVFFDDSISQPITLEVLEDIARCMKQKPLRQTPEELWDACALAYGEGQLVGKFELVDFVVLIWFIEQRIFTLSSFRTLVTRRFDLWFCISLAKRAELTSEQFQWLEQIAGHIATRLNVSPDDLNRGWFAEHGGLEHAKTLFGSELVEVIELNARLLSPDI